MKQITFKLLVLLIGLSAYIWRFIPQQVIRGDGFVYFISKTQQEFFSRDFFYTGFELSAALLGWFLPKIYGINISLYWWTEYFVMLVTHGLFFWFALVIFKKPILAFVAAVFFAFNFFGNWDIYSTHCYCFFIERIIPVLFLLPAGVYLHRFLETRKRKDGIYSLILYFLGIGIGHWSVFITAFFLFYPISWALYPPQGKRWYKAILFGLLYLLITIFFVLIQRIHESGFGLKWSFFDFLLHPEVYQWPQLIIRQLVYWTEYPVLLSGDFYVRMIGRISDMKGIISVTPWIVFMYCVIFGLIYRLLPARRSLLMTCLLGVASLFFLNPLFGQYDVAYQPGANRYLYYPNMLLSLFWALCIEMLLIKQNKLLKGLAFIIFVGYIVINARLIRESYSESMGYNVWTKRVYDYIQKYAVLAPRGTLIVAPYDEVGVYEAIFFTEQLSSKGIKVMSIYNTYPTTDMWQREASSSAHVILLEKDKTCGCLKEQILK